MNIPNHDNHIIASHMSFEPKIMDVPSKFSEKGDNLTRHMSEMEYDDCLNVDEKYSFPYTG